jgi:hypothetical protein
MKTLTWLVALAAIALLAYVLWVWRRRWLEHKRASEQRLANFIVQVKPQAPAVALDPNLPLQKLLLEAAAKAAEAGEPALSIQLYARLLARFPDTAFAAQARSAVETQKRKLAKT